MLAERTVLLPSQRKADVVQAGLVVRQQAAAGRQVAGQDGERREGMIAESVVQGPEELVVLGALGQPLPSGVGGRDIVPQPQSLFGAVKGDQPGLLAARQAADLARDQAKLELVCQ